MDVSLISRWTRCGEYYGYFRMPDARRRRRAPKRRTSTTMAPARAPAGAFTLGDVFALPDSLFDAKTGALTLPKFGTNEFVNVVTVSGIFMTVILIVLDLVLVRFFSPARRARMAARRQVRERKAAAASAPKALNAESKASVELTLAKREQISPDTVRLTFDLPSKSHVLGLPTGQHVGISFLDDDGARHERPYTPTSSDYDFGVVELVIKVYAPCEKFPLGGKVSQFLGKLKVGDTATFAGPKGMKTYEGNGVFSVRLLKSQGGGFDRRRCANVGMIAGGSGITPMLQVSRAMLGDGDDVNISLLFANQTEADILCREEIERDVEKYGESKFRAAYTLDKPPKDWKQFGGFITKEMIQKTMPPPGKKTQILICGPPPMLKFAVLPALEELGYTKDMYLTW